MNPAKGTAAARSGAGAGGERQVTRALLAGGEIGPLLFIVVFLIEGATRPGYSAWRNFVSQLGTSDQGWEQIANFLVCGALCLGLAVGLRRALGGGRGATWGPILLGAFALSLVTAGIFVTGPALGYPPGAPIQSPPPTAHAAIHAVAGLFAFTTLPAACFVLARRFAGDPRWRGWVAYSIATGVVVLLSLVGSNYVATLDMSGQWPSAPAGLIQRVGIIAGWTWIAALAARLLRQGPPHSERPAAPESPSPQ